MREYGLVVQEISLRVKTNHLAARPESGVNCKCTFLTYRCCKQELTQVFSKDADGLNIRLFLGFAYDFTAHRRLQKTFETVFHCEINLLCKRPLRIAVGLAILVIDFLTAFFRITVNLDAQHPLILSTENRKQTVRCNVCKRL